METTTYNTDRVTLTLIQDKSHGNEFAVSLNETGYDGQPLDLLDVRCNEELNRCWYRAGSIWIYPGMEGRFIRAAVQLGHTIDLLPC